MIVLWTAGSIIKNPRGSLENKPGEGVRVNLDRWIKIGRCISDGRGKETPARSTASPDAGAMAGAGDVHGI